MATKEPIVEDWSADGVNECHEAGVDHERVMRFIVTWYREVGAQPRGPIVKLLALEGRKHLGGDARVDEEEEVEDERVPLGESAL